MRALAPPLAFCGLAVVLAAGCSSKRVEEAAAPANSQSPKIKSPVNQAADRALANWGQALAKWSQSAGPSTGRQSAGTQPAYVDIAALARRHPLWRLADAVQNREKTAPLIGTLPARPSALPAFSWPASATATRVEAASAFSGPVIGTVLPGETRMASDLPRLHDEARAKQQAAFDSFLARAGSDQDHDLDALTQSLQEQLTEQVDASKRPELPPLDPSFPADAIELEMTNLRLQLASASRLTPAQRTAAQSRLNALDKMWNATLRAQEEARATELARLKNENPRRLRAEGDIRIGGEIDTNRTRDAALRASVASSHQSRIAEDFGLDDGRLGIVLPALGESKSSSDVTSPPLVPYNLNETTFARAASKSRNAAAGALSGPGSTGSIATPRTAALRARAIQESRRWALFVARRQGWKLVDRPGAGVLNETAETLRMLGW